MREGKANGNYKHGLRHTRLFSIWSNMKTRCYNPNVKSYKTYGLKGVRICEKWLSSFQSFYDWAISNGYADNLTIDRINVNGNYEPSNCRWVDYRTQAQNKTVNHLVTFEGKTLPLDEWSRRKGISPKTVRDRLKRGWSYERALNTPPDLRWSHG